MSRHSDDLLLAARGIAPLPITSGRLRRWIGRMFAPACETEGATRSEMLPRSSLATASVSSASSTRLRCADALADLPDHLRRDSGLQPRNWTTRLESRVRFGLPL